MELQASLLAAPSLRMPQRAPGLPENSGITAVSKDSVVGLSFRVQPGSVPLQLVTWGQVTQPSNEEKRLCSSASEAKGPKR